MELFNQEDIYNVLTKVVENYLIPRFDELGMNSSGEWRSNLEVVATEKTGTIRGRHYSEQLAKGRKFGKMPPVQNIEGWVNDKLGIYGGDARSMAWAISKKIAEEGTTWYRKGGSSLLEVLQEPQVKYFVQRELRALATIEVAERLRRNALNTFNR